MNEKYRNIESNEIVKIVDENGQFYTLNNGMKINMQLFTKKFAIINNSDTIDSNEFLNQKTNIPRMRTELPNLPNRNESVNNDEYRNTSMNDTVNPDDFFNMKPEIKGVDQALQKMKNMDTSKIIDNAYNTSVIVDRQQEPESNPNFMEEEKKRLMEKYKTENQDTYQEPIKPEVKLNENGLTEIQEHFREEQIRLFGEDPYADKVAKYKKQQIQNTSVIVNNIEQKIGSIKIELPVDVPINDPVYSFFKSSKRNHDIKIKFEIKDKIGNPDFIKMMSENLDGDFIKYYTDDIITKFLSDTTKLKELVYEQVRKEIFGDTKHIIIDEIKEKIDTNKPIYKDDKLIPGKKTKTGQQTYKYINEKGNIVDMLQESAEKKGLKSYKK